MHLPTLVLLSLLINFIVGVLLGALYRRKPGERSFALWCAASFLFIGGGVCSLLREYQVSYLIGYFLADALLIASAGLVLAGVLRFTGYRPDAAVRQHIFTASCFTFLTLLFLYANPAAITMVSSVLIGCMLAICANQASRTTSSADPYFGRALRSLFFIHAGIMFLQAMLAFKRLGLPALDFSHGLLSFTLASHLLLTIMTAILLPWMAFFREEKRLSDKSQRDGLTKLANREFFLDCLERHWVNHPEMKTVVMMADIDHFKSINDRYGHTVGDHVIREVAGAIVRSLRKHDLTGRVGGEEFAALLPDIDEESAEEIGQRVRQEVEKSVRHPDIPELRVTMSIGMVEACPDRHPRHSALKAADKALYESKNRGRNRLTLGVVS